MRTQGRLDQRAVGEGPVHVGGVEALDPGEQGEVRRGGVLRLQRDDPADGLADGQVLAGEQHLPLQGGAGQRPRRSGARSAPAALLGAALGRRALAAHPLPRVLAGPRAAGPATVSRAYWTFQRTRYQNPSVPLSAMARA